MANWKKLIVSVGIGIILGAGMHFVDQNSGYSSGNVEGFMLIVLGLSLFVPLAGALQVANVVQTEIFKTVTKRFFLYVLFTALSLLLGAVTYTYLYCTFGACSEFAGLEILFAAIWIPIMTIISALLTLLAVQILKLVKRG